MKRVLLLLVIVFGMNTLSVVAHNKKDNNDKNTIQIKQNLNYGDDDLCEDGMDRVNK